MIRVATLEELHDATEKRRAIIWPTKNHRSPAAFLFHCQAAYVYSAL